MNHAATTESLTQVPYLSSRLFRFRFPTYPEFNASFNASAQFCTEERRQVEELVRLDPFRDWRLSRERLSNGLSLRFAYGWVRKSASRKRDGRCHDRRNVSGEETTARVLSPLARSSRADNARRRTITPIKILRYRISPVSCRFRFIVFPRPRS